MTHHCSLAGASPNRMRVLGLIGGIGHVTTIDYYRGINEAVSHRTGGAQYPQLAIHSLNFREVQELWNRGAWDEFLELVTRVGTNLTACGAEGLLLCANTAHVVADDLQQRLDIPVISIVDATVQASAKRYSTVGLLGTRCTMERGFFKDRLRNAGINTIIPDTDDREFLQTTIFSELARGELKPATKARYLDIIAKLGVLGAEATVLGCTDIHLLVKPADAPMPLLDTMALHVQAAADFVVGAVPSLSDKL